MQNALYLALEHAPGSFHTSGCSNSAFTSSWTLFLSVIVQSTPLHLGYLCAQTHPADGFPSWFQTFLAHHLWVEFNRRIVLKSVTEIQKFLEKCKPIFSHLQQYKSFKLRNWCHCGRFRKENKPEFHIRACCFDKANEAVILLRLEAILLRCGQPLTAMTGYHETR